MKRVDGFTVSGRLKHYDGAWEVLRRETLNIMEAKR